MNERDKKIAEQANWPESLVSPVIMAKLKEFANLIRSDERECIKAANAPEIERINSYIKNLEALEARENK